MSKERYRHYDDFRAPKKIEEGGLIRLSGQFLLDHEEELLSLIRREGKLAEERNPDHKIVNIEKADGAITVSISEHNLAMHIGKALSRAYKGEHAYKFLNGEKYVEVDWKRD
ncbi:MAG: hypothetical protein JW782_02000 [Candidatus Saganbacteria bacterium]|nr:hypothetical protein [Candidatus Saganbacteria bacterium]